MDTARPGRRWAGATRTAALLLLVALSGSACKFVDVPTDEELVLPPLSQTSLLFDADNRLIRTFHATENRTIIPLESVPVIVRQAVVAIEDQRFYSHRGVDVKALVRAAYANVRSGGIVQGGSTITEQLVKNTITGGERTLDRKIREAIIAYRLEQTHSKDWILEQYLNTVYFGRGAYGIDAAAKTYFARPAGKLTVGQGALLAGVIRSPASYDPISNPEAAMARRNLVLQRMLDQHMIDSSTYEAAIDNPLGLKEPPATRYPAPYFVQEVIAWLVNAENTTLASFGADREERFNTLYNGGLRIYTTVDLSMQRMAEDAVAGVLTEKTDPYGSMTVLDPRTGAVRAMVGGRDFFAPKKVDSFSKVNLATFRGGTGRHAGSAFKPFTLVAALENGINPLQTYPAPSQIDIPLPEDCRGDDEAVWTVDNYEGVAGGVPTVRQATVASLNAVFAQMVQDLGDGDPCAGAEKVVEAAHRMGIQSYLRAVPSVTLGTNEVNTLEMASGFGTLATMGLRRDPFFVTRITDAQGTVLYEHPEAQPGRPAVHPGVAWTAVDIMTGVIEGGTGHAADIGRPAAGKTGTAQQWRDAWFVGFIPQLVTAVWVGFPEGEEEMTYPRTRLARVTGGSWPAMIWHDFMAKATAGLPVQDFRKPQFEYISVAIDITRGCLPSQFTLPQNIKVVQFIKGTEPTERCDDDAQEIPVPSVVGLQRDQAIDVLESYAFRVAVQERDEPGAEPGTVLEQDPRAGHLAFQGSTVTIVVASEGSSGAVVVPNVIGLHKLDAIARLQAAGLRVDVIERWECRPPDTCGAVDNEVWDQDPSPGTEVPEGTTVTIWANKDNG